MDPTTALGEEEQDQPTQQDSHLPQHIPQCCQRTKTPSREPTGEAHRKPVRKAKVKWPKASVKQEWRSFDQNLYTVLQNSIRGCVTAKLNIFGDIVYEEGNGRFGELRQRKIPVNRVEDEKGKSCNWYRNVALSGRHGGRLWTTRKKAWRTCGVRLELDSQTWGGRR